MIIEILLIGALVAVWVFAIGLMTMSLPEIRDERADAELKVRLQRIDDEFGDGY